MQSAVLLSRRFARRLVRRTECRNARWLSDSSFDDSLSPEENLRNVLDRLQIDSLPPAPPLGGLYKPIVQTGKYVFVSGQPPLNAQGDVLTGVCVNADDTARAKEVAMWNGLTMLATLKVRVAVPVAFVALYFFILTMTHYCRHSLDR